MIVSTLFLVLSHCWTKNQKGLASGIAKLMFKRMPVQFSIAVVDDDTSVLKSLARLLRSAGYAVESFTSPQECLGSWGASRPQCYVIDVQMPEMSGFELLARLRQKGCQSPAIFITAHDSSQARACASQSGTAKLLLKPFEGTDLLSAVSKIVQPLET